MTQLRLLLALSLTVVACKKDSPPPDPKEATPATPTTPGVAKDPGKAPTPAADAITKEEVEKFGKDFAAALSPCDPAKVDAMIDAKGFTARFDEKTRREVGTFDKLGESLCAGLGADSSVRFVGVIDDKGTLRPRVRTVVRGGVNFLDALLARQPDKSVKAVDIYSLRNGEEMSQLLSLVGKLLAHGEAAARAYIDSTQLHGQGQYDQAKRRFMEIPAEVRTKVKAIALQGLTIDVQQPPAVYLASIEDFKKNFPGDSSVTLVEIDGHSLKEDFPKLVESLNVLLSRTNDDPYVMIMRARAHQRAKDYEKAKADVITATTKEPELYASEGADILIEVAIAEKKYGDAVAAMDKMLTDVITKDKMHELLSAEAMYKPLLASKEYKAWRAKK